METVQFQILDQTKTVTVNFASGQGQAVSVVHDASGTGWWWSPQPTRVSRFEEFSMSTSTGRQGNGRPKLAAGIPADGLYACWARMRSFAGAYGVVYRLYEEACAGRVAQAQAPRSGHQRGHFRLSVDAS